MAVGAGIEVGSSWNIFAKTWKNQKYFLLKRLKSQKFSSLQSVKPKAVGAGIEVGSTWYKITRTWKITNLT